MYDPGARLRMAVEGILINRTIDLLKDSEDGAPTRRASQREFRRTIEQFLAICFGCDTIVYDRNIAGRNQVEEFLQKLRQVLGKGFLIGDSVPAPLEMLNNGEEASTIGEILSTLDKIVALNPTVWRDYIISEVAHSLGKHTTLWDEEIALHMVKFQSHTGVVRDFLVNEDTETVVRPILNLLPGPLVAQFTQWCLEGCSYAKDIPPRNLQEFAGILSKGTIHTRTRWRELCISY